MNTYYISKNGNQLGPFPVDEIQSMLMSGEIEGGDFCWTDGMEQWQSIQEWDAALRAEAEIKVPSAPHPQPLGQNALKQSDNQAPQIKKSAGRRKGKGMIIGGIVFVAVVIMGGVFLVLSSRVEKRQMAKNIDAATRTKPGIKSEKIKDAGAKNIDAATRTKPFVNSLGMKFVPVPITGGDTNGQNVMFCVWETRHKDFKAYVDATGYDATKEEDGKAMEFDWNYEASRRRITGDHPVFYVSWEDAQAFCQWLTKKERDAGTITANHEYRLPTDHEWSCAVGIGNDENASDSPWNKSRKISAYPWGSSWPPPSGAGNYRGEESFIYGYPNIEQEVLEGYRDDFSNTAPVGSFRSNDYGIYDLSGNVYEWCEDFYQPYTTTRVLRGGSWLGGSRDGLLSSYRANDKPSSRGNLGGFRCVLGQVNDKAPGSSDPLLENDPQMQVVYGLAYKNGDGVVASERNAILMFRKAALQGNSDGQLLLGHCYSLGEGIERDPKIAVEWYLKSAEQGNRNAQNSIGFAYQLGSGVEENFKTAAKWYSKSALQDGLDGQVSLAHMYMNGDGVPKDPVIAYMLFVLGSPEVVYDKSLMKQLKDEVLAVDEISLSHKMIERWKSDPNSRPSLLESKYERINTDRAKAALSNTDVSEAVAMAKRLPDKPSAPSTFLDTTVASERSAEKKDPTVASHSPESVKSLTALQAFKSGTLDEAKECIRQLDEELKNDAENTRIKLVKSTIMDVFRAEASLIAALNGQSASDKQYQIKMQNLQIASRPSPLTGRVNTTEVERIRRDANEIIASSVARINAAKTDLSKSLNEAKRVIPTPDSEPLSRVWSQIESRNKL